MAISNNEDLSPVISQLKSHQGWLNEKLLRQPTDDQTNLNSAYLHLSNAISDLEKQLGE